MQEPERSNFFNIWVFPPDELAELCQLLHAVTAFARFLREARCLHPVAQRLHHVAAEAELFHRIFCKKDVSALTHMLHAFVQPAAPDGKRFMTLEFHMHSPDLISKIYA